MNLFVLLYLAFAGQVCLLICDLFKIKSSPIIRNIIVRDDVSFPIIELELYLKNIIGKPVRKVNYKIIEKVAKEHPCVAGVFFKRKAFDVVELQIIQRRPIALIKQDHFFVVDATGVIFKMAEFPEEFILPEISCVYDIGFLLTYECFLRPYGKIRRIKMYGAKQRKIEIVNLPSVVVGTNGIWSQWLTLGVFLLYLHEKLPHLDLFYISRKEQLTNIMVNFKKG